MNQNYQIKRLLAIEEMLPYLHLVQQLSPHLTAKEYEELLKIMLTNGYHQVAMFDQKKCIAVSGYWINAKLYSGKYIEIDNFVVAEEYRSKGVGKILLDWMLAEGKGKHNCKTALLDAYVENFKAHRFYYREGFIARGFHYLKAL